ncbi:heavy-metal-associated domain-containing protein [cf. Phormidesmis sp. LEGE 11477]|uniref:heavy-metal-associated domain-containing protein n=1 Tax=cf. Phormidesmis sp. LEGE 11477 TaxID=1828680 RepID=UPI00188108FA|nr:heavy-metal-associated domain-containing protein [cf. Phormidesmis sp. LEGE 11477]MBE9062593.1 heavy-metal-associated domain-containing protein [cf. Phormidesmis sp. LEGE 11477]
MTMTLNVPSIKCEGCGDTITKEIKVHDADAKVSVDIENKTVEVDSTMSESSVKQAITSAGHEVA